MRVSIKGEREASLFYNRYIRPAVPLLDHSSDMIFIKDLKGRYLFMNKAGRDFFRVKKAWLKTDFEIFPRKTALTIRKNNRIALKKGSQHYSLSIPLKSGALSFDVWNHALKFPGTKTSGVIGFVRDVTAHAGAEARVRESENEFRLVAETIMQAIFIRDAKTLKAFYLSPQLAKMTGVSLGKMMKSPSALFKKIGPKRKEILDPFFKRLFAEGKSRMEFDYQKRPGVTVRLESQAYLTRDSKGAPSRILGLMEDVTERDAVQKKLELYRSLTDEMSDGLVIADPRNARVVDCNEGMLRLLGYTRSEFLKMRVDDFCSIATTPGIYRSYCQRAKSKGIVSEVARFRCKDGSTLPVEVRLSVISRGGKDYGMSVIRDISQKELSRGILGAQEAELTRFARDLHDGVNQRLGMIKFRLMGLDRQVLPANRPEVRTLIKELEKTISEVRNLSRRARTGAVEDLGISVALRRLCADVSEGHDLKVTFSSKGAFKSLPSGNAKNLFRIAQEALSNACRHSNAASVKIQLHCVNGSVSLEIRDDGEGIKKRKGLVEGIGLINISERAAMLGGTLRIRSSKGAGTSLKVVCPLRGIKI